MDQEYPNTSPLPPKQVKEVKEYDLFEALKAISQGKRITKKEWADNNIYCILTDGEVRIMLTDGILHPWIISDGDLAGLDWIILD